MVSKLKISVPNPCTQPWDEMTSTQGGKFCQHCEREVIDFSSMSNNELTVWFSNSNRKICGRFTPSQLSGTKVAATNNWKIQSIRILLASCLTVAIGLKANAIVSNREKVAYHQQKDRVAKMEIKNLEVFRIDSIVFIKGNITANDNKLPLNGVKLWLKDSKQNALTNEKGNFSMEVKMIPNQKIILIFSYLGYEVTDMELIDSRLNPIFITAPEHVEANAFVLGGAVAGVNITLRAPFYKQIWDYIKRQFSPPFPKSSLSDRRP